MTLPDRVLVELLIAAPIDTVWQAVRDPKEIARWFGWEYERLLPDIDMMFIDGAEVSEADHTFRVPGMMDRFALEACGDQCTIVRIIRSAPVTDKSWMGVYDDSIDGWFGFAQQLRFLLARHPGAARQTLYLNGRAATAATPVPPDALGLTPLAIVQVGQRYSVTTPFGEPLTGEFWFRTANQIGLTADAYGDGLIVVTTRPITAKSAFGGGNIVITSYGLDPAALSALRARWAGWWRGQYEVIEITPAE
jgi:hypothetical protein